MTRQNALWGLLLFFYFIFLMAIASSLSITWYEATLYFKVESSVLYYPLHWSTAIFGQNDSAIRLPMVLMHIISSVLYFKISKRYLPKPQDQIWNIIVFVLLPGAIVSAMLVHVAGLILMLLLLFVYLYQKDQRFMWLLLPLYILVDYSFFILAFGIFLLSIIDKHYYKALFAFVLFCIAFYMGDIYSVQTSHSTIVRTLTYLNILISPLLFLYFLYVIFFRIPTRGEKEILWAISLSALAFSLILSMRQTVGVEFYEPYVIVALPLLFKQFMHSFRIRIKKHRKYLNVLFVFTMTLLIVSSTLLYINKYFLHLVDRPRELFLYQHYFVSELAQKLHKEGITGVKTSNAMLRLRLRFYGIEDNNEYSLIETNKCEDGLRVTISYINREIISYCVTKISK